MTRIKQGVFIKSIISLNDFFCNTNKPNMRNVLNTSSKSIDEGFILLEILTLSHCPGVKVDMLIISQSAPFFAIYGSSHIKNIEMRSGRREMYFF